MAISTLNARRKVFLSRNAQRSEGEDPVMNQNSEHGHQPEMDGEAANYP